MSFLKLNGGTGVALVALAMLMASSQAARASANTITLECSYDGYPNRASFIIDVNKDKNTVTINHPAESLGDNYVPPSVEGPYPAVIDDNTISWHFEHPGGHGDTSIDRMTGKAMSNGTLENGRGIHVPMSCHAAQKQF
jgi:hypothetical protein